MKKRYTVLSPVRLDGKNYAVGAQIDLEDSEAAALHEGVIDGAALEIVPLVPPADEAERIAAVVAAIAKLDTANPGQWLKDGKPKTDALAALTGWPVVAADRDAAWVTGAGQV